MTTRRGFVAAVGGVGAIASLPFGVRIAAAQAAAPRMRLEEFVKDPKRLASLRQGVQVMKSRLPSDPTSWFFQGAIHAVTPEAVEEAAQRDPNVRKVDTGKFWNQCPHGGNFNSADFLIWHRAYLYFFERILRAASGDPTLSVPYWNYTDAKQRGFPAAFANAENGANPLYDRRRELAFVSGQYDLNEKTVGTDALFAEVDFFGPTEDTGLAGGVGDSDGATRGRIEQVPHDMMHFAIGGVIGTANPAIPARGLMASVSTAAFDPIFWVHHTNIDRIWTVWDCLTNPPRKWGSVPADAWLRALPWSFHDADKSVKNHSRLHYMKRSNLGVAYDSDNAGCTPLSATDPLAGAAALGGSAGRRLRVKAQVGVLKKAVRVGPAAPLSFGIPLASTIKPSVAAADPNRRYALELNGIQIEGVPSSGFDVFANLPKDARPDRLTPFYIGTIAFFGVNEPLGGHAHGKATQRFDITRVVRLADFNPAQLRLSVVPFDLLVPRTETTAVVRRAAGVRWEQARVVVLEP